MNVKNCRKCGKIFNYVSGPQMCPACREALEEQFQKVKAYINENRSVGVHEVAEACEVEVGQIRQWIREERLEFADGSASDITCENCGTPILTGRFCDKCKNQMANNLSSTLPKPKVQEPVKKEKESPRMRFLDK